MVKRIVRTAVKILLVSGMSMSRLRELVAKHCVGHLL
jgi:hypothetical protein